MCYYLHMETVKHFSGYLSVEIAHLVPDSVVSFSIFLERNGKLLLYKPSGETVTEENIERMLRMGSKVLYIEEEEKRGLFDYYQNNIDYLLKSEYIAPLKKSVILHGVSEHIMEKSFQKPELQDNFRLWEKTVRDNFTFMMGHQEVFESMITVAEKDQYTYIHSVNVGLLMLGCAVEAGVKDQQEILQIGMGGLLHDIGKAMVPDAIIRKQGALSREEWVIIKKHPEVGLKLLAEHRQIGEQSRIIVAQHHEAVNGAGYPARLEGESIDYWARMCKIVDAYDAMTSNRSYSFAVSPMEAMRRMIAGDGFDRRLMKFFITFLNIDHMNRLRDRMALLQSSPG